MSKIKLVCKNCNSTFEKLKREYNRQIKRGREHFFCSLSCSVKHNHKENKYDYSHSRSLQNRKHLKKICGNRGDDLTPFRWFVLRAKYRAKRHSKKECAVSAGYLKQLYDNQNGICPLTGWELSLPVDTKDGFNKRCIKNASLDRIDNSKGYIEGNVRFISVIANLAKAGYTDEDVIEFCKAVAENSQTEE